MGESDKLNEIVAGCKRGDSEAFSQLLDMYAGRCFGYFYRLSGNREVSNDLLSTLFIKLVEKFGSFKGGSFNSWLFTIASNIFYDYLRHQQRQKRLIDGKTAALRSKTPPTRADIEMSDTLQMQLDKLDKDTAELLIMRFYGQFTFKELSKMRDEPIGTTLSKVHRGLKKLRGLMEAERTKE
ncbi:MAG: RNA polymerase sigma factor [Planctomycetes bacterium]|nr:RNA polymerase sigma factor [Planctomycetota bacterium]